MKAARAAAVVVAALCAFAAPAHAVPACFAAAARDPQHPCSNPALRLVAKPGLTRSLITPSYPCQGHGSVGNYADRADGALFICEFGTPAAQATRTVALIGDSHAMAWRAGIAAALKRLGWHGIDLTRSHCAFSAAVRALDEPAEVDGCLRFNARVLQWLEGQPEVTAAILAHQTAGTPYITPQGISSFKTETRGFEQAWMALPPSITNVFAIRDNPSNHNAYAVANCISKARRVKAALGPYCARPRKDSLRPDAFPLAIRALDGPRYSLLDFSNVFCSPQKCFPVIGGALVTKDGRHLTRVFSNSLGPIIARAIARVSKPYDVP